MTCLVTPGHRVVDRSHHVLQETLFGDRSDACCVLIQESKGLGSHTAIRLVAVQNGSNGAGVATFAPPECISGLSGCTCRVYAAAATDAAVFV